MAVQARPADLPAVTVPVVVPVAALFAATVAQRPSGGFVYDAARYFNGSHALFTAADTVREGDLDFRGVLTTLPYAPAALAEHLVTGAGRYAVLAENALLVAVIGAVLLPGLAIALRGPGGPARIWVCAALTWFVAARFAPYPLMDLPAATGFLTAAWLALREGTWWSLGLAGVAAGVTLNLRPAYLLPLVALGGLVAVTGLWPAAWFAAGVLAGSLPQVVFNLVRGSGLGLTPPGTAGLVGFQAGYASYIVRYDTVTSGGPPQQFSCDPSMAAAVAGHPVDSTAGLVAALARNLPGSALFLLEKVAAALAWSSPAPYSVPAGTDRYDLALPVTVIVVAGLVLARSAGLTVLAAGVAASLMTSATETRFALPLVLLGIAGCAAVRAGPGPGSRRLAAGAAAVALLLAAAAAGVAHPLPPGPATPAACAAR